jgi:hypothetical protein
MPSFERIDAQKREAKQPPGARTSLPILSGPPDGNEVRRNRSSGHGQGNACPTPKNPRKDRFRFKKPHARRNPAETFIQAMIRAPKAL